MGGHVAGAQQLAPRSDGAPPEVNPAPAVVEPAASAEEMQKNWPAFRGPGGIGIAEGVFALTLRSLLVPLGAATVITLGFRGVTFWVPLVVGLFTFRLGSRLDSRRRATRLEKTNGS